MFFFAFEVFFLGTAISLPPLHTLEFYTQLFYKVFYILSSIFLNIEQKFHQISILYYIVFSFQSKCSNFLCTLPTLVSNKILIRNHFCSNKSFFKICMNFSRSLWSCIPYMNGPRSYFLYPCCKISL